MPLSVPVPKLSSIIDYCSYTFVPVVKFVKQFFDIGTEGTFVSGHCCIGPGPGGR